MLDKSYRSFLKTVSWRITGTLDTILVSYLITGSIKLATSIGGLEVFTKMILYYFHERAWNKSNIGRETSKQQVFAKYEEANQ